VPLSIGQVMVDRKSKESAERRRFTSREKIADTTTPDGSRDHELITCMSGARDRAPILHTACKSDSFSEKELYKFLIKS
jgi:hypothetical protein